MSEYMLTYAQCFHSVLLFPRVGGQLGFDGECFFSAMLFEGSVAMEGSFCVGLSCLRVS